jgi:hypothetical protein
MAQLMIFNTIRRVVDEFGGTPELASALCTEMGEEFIAAVHAQVHESYRAEHSDEFEPLSDMSIATMSDTEILEWIEMLKSNDEHLEHEIQDRKEEHEEIAAEIARLRNTLEMRASASYGDAMTYEIARAAKNV